MRWLSLILLLLCCYVQSSSSSRASAYGSVKTRISDLDLYDLDILLRVYYGSLQQITLPDAERFERLVAFLERAHSNVVTERSYGLFLLEMIRQDRLEEFRTLLPLITFNEHRPYDIYLLMECIDKKVLFAEFIYSQCFNAERFLRKLKVYSDPDAVIDLIEWLTGRDAIIAERRPEILQDLVRVTLKKWNIALEDSLEVVSRLVRLGCVVDRRHLCKIIYQRLQYCGDQDDILNFIRWIGWLAERDSDIASQRNDIFQDLLVSLLHNTDMYEAEVIGLVQRLVCLGTVVDGRVIGHMDDVMRNHGLPGFLIDIVDRLSGRDPGLASQKAEIYRNWIRRLLQNTTISFNGTARTEMVRRLVALGAAVDEVVTEECKRALPEEAELFEFLHANSLPDVKEPEC